MTLRGKFGAVFAGLGLVGIAGAGVVFWSIAESEADGVLINLAGAQRMLSQRMTKEALMLAQGQGSDTALRASVARFQKVLTGLRNGDTELKLPPCTEPKVMAALVVGNEIWTPFRQAAEQVAARDDASGNALKLMLANNMRLLEQMHGVVQLLEEVARGHVRALRIAQGIVLGCTLSLLVMAWIGIVAPLCRRLEEVAATVYSSSAQVSSAAGELSSSSQSLAHGASQQAATLEETSAFSQQVNQQTHRNAESARGAAALAHEASERFAGTGQEFERMVGVMHEINSQSGKISKIIQVIDEIAFQTNILALNAAVEAARAGEAGQGFAVVAGEVRSLAQRSAQAAHDTTALIKETIARSSDGNSRVDHVSGSLSTLRDQTSRVGNLIEGVDSGCQEQMRGMEQVAKALGQLEDVTQRTAAGAEQTAAAAEELSGQSESLKLAARQLDELVGHAH